MEIRLILLSYIINIRIVDIRGETSKTWDNESICNESCNCTHTKDYLGSTEFRASCEGDGQQVLLLSEKLFKEEPIPDRTRKIYVKVSNLSQVIVTTEFLSKWKAYSSCSLDLWYNSKIDFPKICPNMAESNAVSHVFAGIGIAHSETSFLPEGIYAEKDKANLLLQKANILSLNLKGILGDTPLGSLTINNSTIGTIHGIINQPISLSRRGEFKIIDSQIGQITAGGLNLQPGSYAQPIASIEKSSIGILDRRAVSLVGSIEMNLMNSYVGEIRPEAFQFTKDSRLVAKKNKFGVYKKSLAGISCGNKTNIIYENTLIPLDWLQCEKSANNISLITIDDYLHKTCEDNCLYAKEPPVLQTFPTMVTYIVMGVCLLLVILLAVLIGRLMWIYIFSFERKRKPSDAISTVYFAPNNIQSTEMTVFDREPNNYRKQSLSLSLNKNRPESAFISNQFNNEYF